MIQKYLEITPKELYNKIQEAKYVISQQINHLRAEGGDLDMLDELNYQLEVLHEMERIGVRNLTEVQVIRAARIIEKVEDHFLTQRN